MAAKLIFVSGLSGAGKTTLIRAVLNRIPNLHYLKTVTTRPRRPNESDSFEYKFVSDDEYNELRAKSANWDHTDYQGYKYGADVDEIKSLLSAGEKVICSIAPDAEIAESMSKLYGATPIIIWIDTAPEVAKARINGDKVRLERDEDETFKSEADFIFTSTGKLPEDEKNFIELVTRF